MGKQTKTKSRKPESYGKGKVTPVQIAFIVDRYLSDNNFSQTRSTFRTEASDLISKSPVQEAPKSLLTLGAILDEYICLKEQKVMLDQDKWRLEHEKIRVQTLLRGMQDVMNVYNAGGSATPPPPPMVSSVAAQSSATVVPQIDLPIKSPAGYPVYNTPIMMPSSRPSNTHMDPSNFSTPITNHRTSKRRKGPKDVPDALVIAKRSRRHLSANQPLVKGTGTCSQSSNAVNNQKNALQFSAGSSSPQDDVLNGSLVQGSNVAKCLFNQPNQSPPTNFSVPKTPLRANSSADKSAPLETTSTATSGDDVTPQEKTSANCFVISSETIRVSPVKQLTYYSIERNHCISSSSPVKTNLKRLSGRDHVKGRLDFDGSDTVKNSWNPIPDGISLSESDKEGDIFDLDLPNFDAFGVDFSLSELLVDFDIDGEFSCPLLMDSSSNSHSGSPNEPWNVDLGTNQVFSELSSTVTEILSEKDTFLQGPESVTSVKSTTKCIKILSPAKNHRSSSSDQQNLSAKSRLV